MERYGFIREKLDIKLLILFILRRLPGTVEPETLLELCQCDGAIGYFDYSDCLSELVDTGHVERSERGYAITPKGEKNADAVESSLPYSVRRKAAKLLAPVAERLRRSAMIQARHKTDKNGCAVELSMADDKGEVMSLRLLCAGEQQAQTMEKRFRLDAEGYYQQIVQLLSGEGGKA